MSGISTKLLQAAAVREVVSSWIALLGGTGADIGNAVAIDSANNIIVVGQTSSDGAGGTDFLIAKYNSAGALQWDRTLGGTGTDIGRAVAIDSANNIIVTGYTASDGAGGADVLIAKYNSAGALQWDRTLGGTGTDLGNAVAIDSANNIIVVGYTTSDGAGGTDLLIAKYNSAGALQWDRTLGGTGADIGNAVAIDSADNIIVVGYTTSDGAGGTDFLIAKYNSAGALQWDRTLGGTGTDLGRAVAIDSANNIIVTGQTSSDGAGGNDFLIAKYNSAGALQWDRTLGGTGTDIGNAVAIDSANNIIVVGYTTSDGAGGDDLLIAKYNSAGALQWDRTLGGTGAERGNAVAIDSADNIIVTGQTSSDGAGGNDFLIAKLPPDGSGTGTYGSFTYEAAVLTDAPAVLTDALDVLTDAPAVLTDVVAVLTDAPAVLTEELIDITL
jgi:uncharacterized delta-60 repeat protein